MLETLGWICQFLGLVVVGTGLVLGLASGNLRTELVLLGVGGGLFLLGRGLGRRPS